MEISSSLTHTNTHTQRERERTTHVGTYTHTHTHKLTRPLLNRRKLLWFARVRPFQIDDRFEAPLGLAYIGTGHIVLDLPLVDFRVFPVHHVHQVKYSMFPSGVEPNGIGHTIFDKMIMLI